MTDLRLNLNNTNRRIRIIDSSSQARLKCEECGQPTLHIYKQDPSLYFCGNCANTVPIREAKHDLVVIPTAAEKETFIVQSPRRKQGRKKSVMQKELEKKGLQLTQFEEIKPQAD